MDPALERLARISQRLPEDAFETRITLGPMPDGALLPDRPEAGVLAAALAAMSDAAAADAKLRAAYLAGAIGRALCAPLAELALSGLGLPSPEAGALGLTARRVPWERDGDSGVSTVFDLVVDPSRLTGGPTLAGAVLTRLCAPLISDLSGLSGLSRGALWRLIGDSISAALLEAGKRAGRVEEAMTLARAILFEPESPLRSRQTGFIEVAPEGRPDLSDWFRVRGGCCRYYTLPGGEYCTTCVLRDRASREARLRDYLLRRAEQDALKDETG